MILKDPGRRPPAPRLPGRLARYLGQGHVAAAGIGGLFVGIWLLGPGQGNSDQTGKQDDLPPDPSANKLRSARFTRALPAPAFSAATPDKAVLTGAGSKAAATGKGHGRGHDHGENRRNDNHAGHGATSAFLPVAGSQGLVVPASGSAGLKSRDPDFPDMSSRKVGLLRAAPALHSALSGGAALAIRPDVSGEITSSQTTSAPDAEAAVSGLLKQAGPSLEDDRREGDRPEGDRPEGDRAVRPESLEVRAAAGKPEGSRPFMSSATEHCPRPAPCQTQSGAGDHLPAGASEAVVQQTRKVMPAGGEVPDVTGNRQTAGPDGQTTSGTGVPDGQAGGSLRDGHGQIQAPVSQGAALAPKGVAVRHSAPTDRQPDPKVRHEDMAGGKPQAGLPGAASAPEAHIATSGSGGAPDTRALMLDTRAMASPVPAPGRTGAGDAASASVPAQAAAAVLRQDIVERQGAVGQDKAAAGRRDLPQPAFGMVGAEGSSLAGDRPDSQPASPARIDEGSGLVTGMSGPGASGQNTGAQAPANSSAHELLAPKVPGPDNRDPKLLHGGLRREARGADEGVDQNPLTEAGTAAKGGVPLAGTGSAAGPWQARSQSAGQSPGVLPVQGSVDPFTGDDELIVEFRTARGEVTETITGFGTRAATYLPLGEIARLLDLALVVSDDGNYVAGWVLDEKQVVALNLRDRKLTTGDGEKTLGPHDAQAFDGELYLRSDLFASLMPLDLKVDLRAQSVTVLTHRPFPFEQRAVRDAARERLAGRSAGRPDNGYVRQETPYRALDVPLGDLEFRAVSDVAQGRRGEADLRLAADFAYMTGQAYVSAGSRDGPTAARITLGRRDPDSRLLGALHASAFEIGDVSTEALAMGVRGIAGRGIMVSNAPIERASIFDRIDLRGELPDGYEAELYRNNTLVGSTRTSRNGRYEFLQIPVEFGLNVMRVVLYGPQGQRRETVRQVSVGDGRLATGELRYGFSVAQKDVTLLGLQGPEFVPGRDHGRWRASGQLAYGISSAITASLGGAWYDSETGQQWLATAGLRTSLGSVASQVNLGFNGQGGSAIETRLAATTRGIGWAGIHTEYRGLFSDEVRAFSIEPLRRASEAEITATVRLGAPGQGLTIPVAGRMRRIQFADGKVQLDGSLRASSVAGRVLLSNTLSLSRSQTPGIAGTTQVLGSFDLSSLSGSRTRFRASLGYAIAPKLRVTQGRVELDRTFGPRTLVKLSAGRTFDSHETTLGTSAVHRIGPFALALDSSITLPRKEHAVVARIGVSFGRNPVSQSWFLAQPGLAAGGAVAVSAFVDANGNRQRDRDEALVDDVEFDTGTQVARSDRAGVALLGQLGNANRTFLRLNAESLPDLAMAPAAPGFEFVPRPGRIHVSQFAIDTLGEIEGIAVFGAEQKGVSGLVLALVDASGRQVGRVRTSGGGTFLFEQVRPGTYRVVIDPGQAKRLALVSGLADAIVLDGKQQVIRVTLPVHKQESP